MVAPPPSLEEAERFLAQAAGALAAATHEVKTRPDGEPWRDRADDLGLLEEEVVDIRQQIAFLKLEIVQPQDG